MLGKGANLLLGRCEDQHVLREAMAFNGRSWLVEIAVLPPVVAAAAVLAHRARMLDQSIAGGVRANGASARAWLRADRDGQPVMAAQRTPPALSPTWRTHRLVTG